MTLEKIAVPSARKGQEGGRVKVQVVCHKSLAGGLF